MSLLGRVEDAEYKPLVLPEYTGNPLIEALPEKQSQTALLNSLAIYPDLPDEFRYTGDALNREEFLIRIDTLRQPLEIYFDVFRDIERAIKQGYCSKSPLSATTQNFLHYPVGNQCAVVPNTGRFVSTARGITLIGESGTGKTTMLEQILLHFPQVIKHHIYKGETLGFRDQIVWIKVECPDKSSVRELCLEILLGLDEAAGFDFTKPESRTSDLMVQIEQRIKSCNLGLLVIDEMQNIHFERTSGESGLLKFIKKIVNSLGVPIVFCANPPFDMTLMRLSQNARRGESGGAYYMDRLAYDSPSWTAFISQLWQLQWTNVQTPLTDALSRKLYDLSVGNIDFARRTYTRAQRLVMGTGDESICEAVLQDAYERECIFSSRSADTLNAREELNQNKVKAVADQVETSSETKHRQPFIPSVDRPQHPEFYVLLQKVFNSTSLREDITDPDEIRHAKDARCAVTYLREKQFLCEDPLTAKFFD